MLCAVDEVGEGDQGRTKTYGWSVHCCDEDLWMRIECLSDIEVIGDEALEPELVGVLSFWCCSADRDIGTSAWMLDAIISSLFVLTR